jgi:WD40 repeat protein
MRRSSLPVVALLLIATLAAWGDNSTQVTLASLRMRPGDVRQLKALRGNVSSVAFSPQGEYIVAGGRDSAHGVVCVWETETGKLIRRFHVSCLETARGGILKDGRRVFGCGNPRHLYESWDLRTGIVEQALKEPGEQLIDLAEVAFFETLFQCQFLLTGRRGEPDEVAAMLHEFIRPWYHSMLAVAPNADRAVSLTLCRPWLSMSVTRVVVRVWDLDHGREIRHFVSRVAFPWRDLPKFWDSFLDSFLDIFKVQPAPGRLETIPSLPDWCLAILGWVEIRSDATLAEFIARDREESFERLMDSEQGRWVLSSDGRSLLHGCQEDGFLRIWDLESGRLLRRMTLGGRIRCIACSPDMKLICAASEEADGQGFSRGYTVQILEARNGRLVSRFSALAATQARYCAWRFLQIAGVYFPEAATARYDFGMFPPAMK